MSPGESPYWNLNMTTSKSSNLVGWQKADATTCWLLTATTQVIPVTPAVLLNIHQPLTKKHIDKEQVCPFHEQWMTPKD